MRKLFVLIALVFLGPALSSAQGNTEACIGIRVLQDMGLELGLQFGDRFSIRVVSSCDWHNTWIFKNTKNDLAGKTNYLMYGGGVSVRVVGPFWLSLDAGYGWHGKYAYADDGTVGITDSVQGLAVGAKIRWDFSSAWFITAGYETIPAGFKLNRPVHRVALGVGFHAPF